MKKSLLLLCVISFIFLPHGVNAQVVPQGEDYDAMLQKAMKSGKFSQSLAENWDARVKKISGDVRVKASGSGTWAVLEGEMPLDLEDSIKTADGVAEIYLDDQGAIAVGRNTELEISSLSKGAAEFTIKFGNIAAKVQHFLDEKFKMQVRTPAALCMLRGTEFAVEYSQLGKDTAVAVFDEGRMAVSPLAVNGQAPGEYLVDKNMELVFAPSQKRFRTVPLSRMSRYRTSIMAMRVRLNVLRKNWKPAGDAKKAAMRDRVFKRNVIHKETDNTVRAGKKGKQVQSVKKALKTKARRKSAPAADEEE